jgi:hypothetical protein
VRLLNGLGSGLESMGMAWPHLSADALVARACHLEGGPDPRPLPYPDGLQRACKSLREDASLSLVGRLAMREHLTLGLRTRIRLLDRLRQDPALHKQPLNSPIIVTGLPRSGTTYLHRLLALDSDAFALSTWRLREPLAGRVDHRRRDTVIALWLLRQLAPELDQKHELRADLEEEDLSLFDVTGWTPTLWRLAPVHGYLQWYLKQDPEPGYRAYRTWLQLLQSERPDKRLTLKLPNHLAWVGTLARVVPEARIIQTHRDPTAIIASYASLASSVHGVHTNRPDPTAMGEASLHLWGTHADRALAQRPNIRPARVLDVDYESLRRDPIATVHHIYSHFDLPFTDTYHAHLQAAVALRVQHRRGRHHYRLADYALAPEAVRARFSTYTAKHLQRTDND